MFLPCPEIASEGVLWFTNLTIPDPTLILPFTIGILNLTNIEVRNGRSENNLSVRVKLL